MSIQSWVAIAVTLVTVWALIKRYETRLVLLAAGLFLCCISLDPMYGLDAMGKSMTNKSLIMAICGSMGFAFVASYTQCDRSAASASSCCRSARRSRSSSTSPFRLPPAALPPSVRRSFR